MLGDLSELLSFSISGVECIKLKVMIVAIEKFLWSSIAVRALASTPTQLHKFNSTQFQKWLHHQNLILANFFHSKNSKF
jgi:hypothetical protein